MLKRMLAAGGLMCGLAVLAASVAAAQPAAAPAPCDPAVSTCYTVQGWLLTERSWTPSGAAPRDLVGGRLQAEIRHARWRFAGRGDATGIPGEYQQDHPETVRSVEAHVATSWDALRLPAGVTLGPAIGLGAALTIEHDATGARPVLPKAYTAGVGFRAAAPGFWLIAVIGQNQALHGVAATATWQIAVSDRVANVGSLAIGPKAYSATFGVGVRFK